jgi:hypothetical protein
VDFFWELESWYVTQSILARSRNYISLNLAHSRLLYTINLVWEPRFIAAQRRVVLPNLDILKSTFTTPIYVAVFAHRTWVRTFNTAPFLHSTGPHFLNLQTFNNYICMPTLIAEFPSTITECSRAYTTAAKCILQNQLYSPTQVCYTNCPITSVHQSR